MSVYVDESGMDERDNYGYGYSPSGFCIPSYNILFCMVLFLNIVKTILMIKLAHRSFIS